MAPKVSVNICCYNSEKYIKETLQSVLDQSYQDYEVIVIDDGSRDKTGEIIRDLNDDRIKYIYQENRGLAVSRNKALELSRGNYIALLDHDDLWLPNKLASQVPLLENDPACGLVYCDGYDIDGQNNIIGNDRAGLDFYRGNIFYELLYQDFTGPCSGVVMRRESCNKVGGFNETYKIAEEYELFLRIAEYYQFDYISEPLVKYRFHNSTSVGKEVILANEILSILEYWLNKRPEIAKDYQNILSKIRFKANMNIALYYLRNNKLDNAICSLIKSIQGLGKNPIIGIRNLAFLFNLSRIKRYLIRNRVVYLNKE